MKEIIKIGIKASMENGYQVWFSIGNQTFSLQPNDTEETEQYNLQSAKFYRKNLAIAYRKAGNKVDVYTNERLNEIALSVNAWQHNDQVHSLTCGNDSTHKNLVPEIVQSQGQVWLRCPDCEYCQTWIPDIVTLSEAH